MAVENFPDPMVREQESVIDIGRLVEAPKERKCSGSTSVSALLHLLEDPGES